LRRIRSLREKGGKAGTPSAPEMVEGGRKTCVDISLELLEREKKDKFRKFPRTSIGGKEFFLVSKGRGESLGEGGTC